jgi:hypothetical protein
VTGVSDNLISYGEWGSRFFEHAITDERVLAGVNAVAGQPIDFGPMGVGPGRVAKVVAHGEIGLATGHRTSSDPLVFEVLVPVELEFKLNLGLDVHRFNAEIEVPLRLTARAREDLAIVIDIEPPTSNEIMVNLKAKSLRASLTQYVVDVEGELRRFIAKFVSREIDKPKVQEARIIDVGGAIDRAASSLVPGS